MREFTMFPKIARYSREVIVTEKIPLDSKYLSQPCNSVPMGEDVGPLIDQMLEHANGTTCVGLAANQVGHKLRVIVMNTCGLTMHFINPVIEKMWGGKKSAIEECLSFPGKKVSVVRYRKLKITAYDRNWEPKTMTFRDFPARVIQHEMDHLNGIDMFKRAKMGSTL